MGAMNILKKIFLPYSSGYDDGYKRGTEEFGAFYDGFFAQKKYLDKAIKLLMVSLDMDTEDKNQYEAVAQAIELAVDKERKNEEECQN